MLAAFMVGASACSEVVEVSPQEAVELFVIDGLERTEAVCIVNSLGPDVDLARMTGVVDGITEEQLMTLAQLGAECRSALVIESEPAPDTTELDAMEGNDFESYEDFAEEFEADFIAERLDQLVRGGLDASVAVCIEELLELEDAPIDQLNDNSFLAGALSRCS